MWAWRTAIATPSQVTVVTMSEFIEETTTTVYESTSTGFTFTETVVTEGEVTKECVTTYTESTDETVTVITTETSTETITTTSTGETTSSTTTTTTTNNDDCQPTKCSARASGSWWPLPSQWVYVSFISGVR